MQFLSCQGGDSIREINNRTGAHVEIDRNHKNLPEGSERTFIIKGSDEQIEYAQQLIYEKITGVQGSQPPSGYFSDPSQASAYGGGSGGGGAPAMQPAAAAWGQYPDQNQAAWAAYYQQYYAASGANPAAAQMAATAQQPAMGANPAAAAVGGAQPDYTQAWVDYYRSMGMHDQAEQILKQQQQSQQPSEEFPSGGNNSNNYSRPDHE